MSLARAAVLSLATYVPGFTALMSRSRRRDPLSAARYCYSVWFRHLILMHENGLIPKIGVVMELGPGDSIGVGLAALLSGAKRYIACDSVRHTQLRDNLTVLNELLILFESQAPIPDDTEFPRLEPKLHDYSFPTYLTDEEWFRSSTFGRGRSTSVVNVDRIRSALECPDAPNSCISYLAPWHDYMDAESSRDYVDIMISQAVLEHVDDLDAIYGSVYRWLAPGGIASHDIDYQCHLTSSRWNGHWTYSDRTWKFIRGRRRYLINREPHSTHVGLLKKYGYEIRTERVRRNESQLERGDLAPRFRNLSEADLTARGAFIQAQKE